jgi:hypothetical protein
MRRILLVLVVAAMISALLPGTAFAGHLGPGTGGHIDHDRYFGGAILNGGSGGSLGHGSGQGGHLTGFLDGDEVNGGYGEGGSVVRGIHQGGGGGGCLTDPVSRERECGKLDLPIN